MNEIAGFIFWTHMAIVAAVFVVDGVESVRSENEVAKECK